MTRLRRARSGRALLLACAPAALLGLPALAQDASQGASPAAPSFTAAQADAGRAVYAEKCVVCHGEQLGGTGFGPPLVGPAFELRWGGRPVAELFSYVASSMPPATPGQLDDATVASLVALHLSRLGVAAGAAPLPQQPEKLAAAVLPGKAAPGQAQLRARSQAWLSPEAVFPAWPAAPMRLEKLTPVTAKMLADPPASDWLGWRGKGAQGFSPLTEITKENAGKLQLAWSLSLPSGTNSSEPLVHDGVMFVWSGGDNILALDAATGDELWHYERRHAEGQPRSTRKNLALHGGRVISATDDGHVIALDARTGRVVWDKPVIGEEPGWRITGGPLVGGGVIMQGVVGQQPGGASIVGLDAETGKELWRFHTVGQPGTPEGDTWNGLPLEARSGGSVWTAGSYDPELDLAYFGPAPTYDTGPMRDPVKAEGVTNDALYTDTTVAIRPKTGELAWYYQHVKNDQWDMDWAFERTIARVERGGETRKLVITAGKAGLFDALDAKTGKYAYSFDMGLQDFITAIDPATGEKTIDPKKIPYKGADEIIVVCPYGGGGRNWPATSLNEKTGLLYVHAADVCMDLIPESLGGRPMLTTGVALQIRPRDGSDGRYGLIEAIDVKTGKIVWKDRERSVFAGSVLATAGGVVFVANQDRTFRALDDATGKELWRTRVDDNPNGSPVSYSVDGKQYVAMLTGSGNPLAMTFPALTPEIPLSRGGGSSLFVFALPDE